MAPFLRPGDVLGVKPIACDKPADVKLRLGAVVVMRHPSGARICHRVIRRNATAGPFPYTLKGDRNRDEDMLDPSWEVEGEVVWRLRNDPISPGSKGFEKRIRPNPLLAYLSRVGMIPGQRLPMFLSRTYWRGTPVRVS